MALGLFRVGRRLSLITDLAIPPVFLSSKNWRSVMTSERKFEKVIEDLKANPYFDKYADKIAKLQETSPDEFLRKIEEKERREKAEKEKRMEERKFQPASKAKPALGVGEVDPRYKKARLSDVMKVELIEGKSREEIVQIWHEYHRKKDCISGVLTVEQFEKLFELGREYPTFLLPLPRSEGYEFIMSQFDGTKIHMTPLLWYQVHKENAPECLSMVHYTDLSHSKDLVLMRGEFDTNSINVQEAQCLANELQLYYSADNPERFKLVEKFTKQPDQFKHMDLIANLETISLVSDPKVVKNS